MKIKKVMSNYTFSSDEKESLRKYRDEQYNPRLKNRFIVLLMLAESIAFSVAASIAGISEKTIKRWFKIYYLKGPDHLNSFNYKARQPRLTEEQVCKLTDWVKAVRPPCAKVVAEWIRENFGLSYCADSVRKIMKKNGLQLLRPKLVPGNPPSEEEQRNFVKEYNEISMFYNYGVTTLFCDAMHLIHQTVPGLCWGDPADPPVFKTNSGRQRLNILGAYDPAGCKLVHHTGEANCDREQVIIFFEKILKAYRKSEFIVLILDNAPYFKAGDVREWLEKHPKIICRFLPPYAPNLNLIERFWRFVKEKMVRNNYFEKYKTFRCHTFRLLNNISNYKKKLKSLITENFEIITYITPDKANNVPGQT